MNKSVCLPIRQQTRNNWLVVRLRRHALDTGMMQIVMPVSQGVLELNKALFKRRSRAKCLRAASIRIQRSISPISTSSSAPPRFLQLPLPFLLPVH